MSNDKSTQHSSASKRRALIVAALSLIVLTFGTTVVFFVHDGMWPQRQFAGQVNDSEANSAYHEIGNTEDFPNNKGTSSFAKPVESHHTVPRATWPRSGGTSTPANHPPELAIPGWSRAAASIHGSVGPIDGSFVAASACGDLDCFATASSDGLVYVWTSDAVSLARSIRVSDEPIKCMDWNSRLERLVVLTVGGTMFGVDPTGKGVNAIDLKLSSALLEGKPSWMSCGRAGVIVIGTVDGWLGVFESDGSFRASHRVTTDATIEGLAAGLEGKLITVGLSNGKVLECSDELREGPDPIANGEAPKFLPGVLWCSPDARYVGYAAPPNQIVLYDRQLNTLRSVESGTEPVWSMATDGSRLFAGLANGRVQFIQLSTGESLAELAFGRRGISGLCVVRQQLYGCATSGHVFGPISTSAPINSLLDGLFGITTICPTEPLGTFLIGTSSGRCFRVLPDGVYESWGSVPVADPVVCITPTNLGTIVVVTRSGSLSIRDAVSGVSLVQAAGHEGRHVVCAKVIGSLLALCFDAGNALVYDLPSLQFRLEIAFGEPALGCGAIHESSTLAVHFRSGLLKLAPLLAGGSASAPQHESDSSWKLSALGVGKDAVPTSWISPTGHSIEVRWIDADGVTLEAKSRRLLLPSNATVVGSTFGNARDLLWIYTSIGLMAWSIGSDDDTAVQPFGRMIDAESMWAMSSDNSTLCVSRFGVGVELWVKEREK